MNPAALRKAILRLVTRYCGAEKRGETKTMQDALDVLAELLAEHNLSHQDPMTVIADGRKLLRNSIAGSRAAIY